MEERGLLAASICRGSLIGVADVIIRGHDCALPTMGGGTLRACKIIKTLSPRLDEDRAAAKLDQDQSFDRLLGTWWEPSKGIRQFDTRARTP
jgi:hypothetical protein